MKTPLALIICISLLSLGCSSEPTPNGTQLFTKQFEALESPAEYGVDVTLGPDDPAVVNFDIQAAQVAGGSRQLGNVSAAVKDNGGWQVSFLQHSNPVNLGTKDAPVMAVSFMLQRYRESLTGKELRQHSVRVKADGTAEVE